METHGPMKIAVVGCSGRMGQMLIRAIDETDGALLSGVTERPGHDWIGRDLGEAMGGAARGVAVSDDPLEVFAATEAVLDFTAPAVTVAHAELTAQARAVHVIGTTGFEQAHLDAFAARHLGARFDAASFSHLHPTALLALTRRAAPAPTAALARAALAKLDAALADMPETAPDPEAGRTRTRLRAQRRALIPYAAR